MNYRILIVDDDLETAKMLKMNLEVLEADYEITIIISGEEAKLEMQFVEFDLLITDYRLPGMTGVELISQVRAINQHIPIILATGQAIPAIQREIAASGHEVVDIFQKPFDIGLIVNQINELLLGEEVAVNVAREESAPAAPAQPESKIDEAKQFTVDEQALFRLLEVLQRQLDATAAALVDSEGSVVSLAGMLDQSLHFSQMTKLLAQNFANNDEIADYLGGVQGLRALHYYSGTDYDIYALPADDTYLMVVVLPASDRTQMGMVLRYARPVLKDIGAMLGGTADAPNVDSTEESYPHEPIEDTDDGEVFLEMDSDTSQFIFRTAEDREQEEAVRTAAAAAAEEAWLAEDNASLDDFFQPADTANAVTLDLDSLDEAIAEDADADDFWNNAVDLDED